MNKLSSIRSEIANSTYLDMYELGSEKLPKYVLLPHESKAVKQAVDNQRNAYEKVVKAKVEVTGGDDWHDGAFRATDNEAKIIGQQMSTISPFINAPVISYPLPTERRVTIGSRVAVNQAGYTFPVDIVGFRAGYPNSIISAEDNEEVTGMSPESPLAKLIMGKEVGFEAVFYNENRGLPVKIERVDQQVIKEYFMREVQVFRISE